VFHRAYRPDAFRLVLRDNLTNSRHLSKRLQSNDNFHAGICNHCRRSRAAHSIVIIALAPFVGCVLQGPLDEVRRQPAAPIVRDTWRHGERPVVSTARLARFSPVIKGLCGSRCTQSARK
jgi:hypothetical protein